MEGREVRDLSVETMEMGESVKPAEGREIGDLSV